jgi:hypothetical protein
VTDPRIGDLIRQRARIGGLIRQAALPWRGHWSQGSGLHGTGQRPRFALSPGLA